MRRARRPSEYRQYPAMHQHPVILAFMARNVLEGAVEGARQAYRTTRSELSGLVPPHAVSAALNDFRAEGLRLSASRRSVELVEWALRGKLRLFGVNYRLGGSEHRRANRRSSSSVHLHWQL
jgi:hypothetical protein